MYTLLALLSTCLPGVPLTPYISELNPYVATLAHYARLSGQLWNELLNPRSAGYTEIPKSINIKHDLIQTWSGRLIGLLLGCSLHLNTGTTNKTALTIITLVALYSFYKNSLYQHLKLLAAYTISIYLANLYLHHLTPKPTETLITLLYLSIPEKYPTPPIPKHHRISTPTLLQIIPLTTISNYCIGINSSTLGKILGNNSGANWLSSIGQGFMEAANPQRTHLEHLTLNTWLAIPAFLLGSLTLPLTLNLYLKLPLQQLNLLSQLASLYYLLGPASIPITLAFLPIRYLTPNSFNSISMSLLILLS